VIVNKKCIEKQLCYSLSEKRIKKQNNFIVIKLETKNMRGHS
jgi:hypothetical protein